MLEEESGVDLCGVMKAVLGVAGIFCAALLGPLVCSLLGHLCTPSQGVRIPLAQPGLNTFSPRPQHLQGIPCFPIPSPWKKWTHSSENKDLLYQRPVGFLWNPYPGSQLPHLFLFSGCDFLACGNLSVSTSLGPWYPGTESLKGPKERTTWEAGVEQTRESPDPGISVGRSPIPDSAVYWPFFSVCNFAQR